MKAKTECDAELKHIIIVISMTINWLEIHNPERILFLFKIGLSTNIQWMYAKVDGDFDFAIANIFILVILKRNQFS